MARFARHLGPFDYAPGQAFGGSHNCVSDVVSKARSITGIWLWYSLK